MSKDFPAGTKVHGEWRQNDEVYIADGEVLTPEQVGLPYLDYLVYVKVDRVIETTNKGDYSVPVVAFRPEELKVLK